ncbi:MAG TPA: helix-turn-helix domain-containing protein [Nitrospiria bacterium]|jgi:excisionase family DNA binding protein
MIPDIMTARQVGAYLQVDERTIYKLARKGGVPSMKISGQWRFKKDLIDAWIEEGCLKNGPLPGKSGKEGHSLRSSVSLVRKR